MLKKIMGSILLLTPFWAGLAAIGYYDGLAEMLTVVSVFLGMAVFISLMVIGARLLID